MKRLNWASFEVKHDGNLNEAFERMTYALFCNRFNLKNGLAGLKNQIGIETEPAEVNGEWIGFQSKYIEQSTKFNAKKQVFIDSLIQSKNKNIKLNTILFYVNKTYSEPTKGSEKRPKYIEEIEKKADELGLKVEWQFPSQIQKQLSNPNNLRIAKEFFPEFIEKDSKEHKKGSREFHLEIARTAQIQIEIAKIKQEFSSDWSENERLVNDFYAFVDFTNETIANQIFTFLHHRVSKMARSNIAIDVASSIEGLVLTYFPSSFDDKDKAMRIENGKQCIYAGFNLCYDAFIYTKNYRVAMWGLNIWKYIYREAKRNEYTELIEAINEQYKDLEFNLARPERNDLENAKELVKIFKEDLEDYSLSFPVLPEELYKLVIESEKSPKS